MTTSAEYLDEYRSLYERLQSQPDDDSEHDIEDVTERMEEILSELKSAAPRVTLDVTWTSGRSTEVTGKLKEIIGDKAYVEASVGFVEGDLDGLAIA